MSSGKDHAGCAPGATDMTLKLLFDPATGKITVPKESGKKGVIKAANRYPGNCYQGNLTVFDLPGSMRLFGSAKDPVNMLGYAALDLIEGLSDNVQWYQLKDELAKGPNPLDVRTVNSNWPSKVSTIHIPLNELRRLGRRLDKNQPISSAATAVCVTIS